MSGKILSSQIKNFHNINFYREVYKFAEALFTEYLQSHLLDLDCTILIPLPNYAQGFTGWVV